ncbi:MAG: galactokinase [Actinomycetota bacterium]|nr:galactokinase [Actinomycetota bacterium]
MNLIGEHTDYNDGYVLPIPINRRTVVAGAPRKDLTLRAWSAQASGEVSCSLENMTPRSETGWGAYVCGTAWSLGKAGVPLEGCDLLIHSSVPPGAGLSSSAALEVSVALAVAEMSGGGVHGRELAMAAHRAEVEFVGVPSGVMDQMVAVFGKHGHALFLDARTLAIEQVPFRPEDSGLTLGVIDTRVKHRLADGQYAERRRACEQAALVLGVASLREVSPDDLPAALWRLSPTAGRRVRHVVTENERVLATVAALRRGDLPTVGGTFVASHASLARDFEVSSPELDLAVEVALEAGAVGARMTGGGFGGSAIALIPEGCVDDLRTSVSREFEHHGFARPAVFTVTTAGGASRIG